MTDPFAADPIDRSWSIPGGATHALLIPGFLGTPREMRPLGEALAGRGLSVRSPLLPGFGPEMGRLREVRAADWLAAAERAWTELLAEARRSVLIGFSMGGSVALGLAAEAPPDRLILLAPYWRFAERLAFVLPLAKLVVRELRPFAGADFRDPDIRRGFAAMAPGLDLDDPAVQARLRREARLPTSALDELRRIGKLAVAAAPRVRAPTAILQASGDRTSLPANTRRLAARIGGPVALHEYPGGHQMVLPDHPSWATTRDLVLRYATGVDGA